MQLFDRVVELKVGNTDIMGLDIAFEIEKDLSPEPNPCHIEIYNLGPDNRAGLSKYGQVPVVLKAGYRDGVGVIFCGDMLRVTHLKEGPAWKTVLASGDGAMAIQTKRIGKSYTKGTPVKTVVDDLAKQMGFTHGHSLEKLNALSKVLERSFVVSGNPMVEITRLLSRHQMTASIQNGSLQVLEKGGSIQKEAILLSAETGLISTPEPGSKGEITIRTLLIAELVPGRQVFVESTVFNGLLSVQQVRFSGATFGQQWESEIIGKV